MLYVVAILGLAVLMIVHEAGHYFAARAFGMRVTKFSIGFGPTFFKIQPEDGYWWFTTLADRIKVKLFKHDPEKHGPTVFQVAMIPFLAYVAIHGLNPLEEVDPDDKGSYANASIWGRITTIIAGPLANYVFASVFFFLPLYFDGKLVQGDPTQVAVMQDMPAAQAGFQDGDRIVEVQGKPVTTWTEMSDPIYQSPGKEIEVVVLRSGERHTFHLVPKPSDEGKGRIGVTPYLYKVDVGAGEAAKLALVTPPMWVKRQLDGFAELFRGKSEAKLGGPKAMVDEMKRAAETGWSEFVTLLGVLSAILAAFNLLPIPALDGGRLLFLGYEAATKKRANPTVEAHLHVIGLVMMLGLMIYVTLANDFGLAK